MRVLLVTGSFPPMKCGVGDYTASLAEALSRQEDAEVAVLTRVEGRASEVDPKVQVNAVVKDWGMADLPRIIGVLRGSRPDVVHLQFPTQGYRGRVPWLLPLLVGATGVTTVQTWHEYLHEAGSNWRDFAIAIAPSLISVVREDYGEKIPRRYRWLLGGRTFHYIPSASSIPTVLVDTSERASIREKWGSQGRSLVAYFGFLYEHKGIDLLFQIADPQKDHLVILGEFDRRDPYQDRIWQLANQGAWRGRAEIAGFQPSREVSRLLAVADAVVLPFRKGGGEWNTSLLAARAQGTFVLTTSWERRGYAGADNVYYANPGDVHEMRTALRRYIGQRREASPGETEERWDLIADSHMRLYQGRLRKRS